MLLNVFYLPEFKKRLKSPKFKMMERSMALFDRDTLILRVVNEMESYNKLISAF